MPGEGKEQVKKTLHYVCFFNIIKKQYSEPKKKFLPLLHTLLYIPQE